MEAMASSSTSPMRQWVKETKEMMDKRLLVPSIYSGENGLYCVNVAVKIQNDGVTSGA